MIPQPIIVLEGASVAPVNTQLATTRLINTESGEALFGFIVQNASSKKLEILFKSASQRSSVRCPDDTDLAFYATLPRGETTITVMGEAALNSGEAVYVTQFR